MAVGGVVAALSLAVALTVMVASFRESVSSWLQVVLPADLYLRAARNTQAGDTANLPPAFVAQVAGLAGVRQVVAQRTRLLQLDAQSPAVALLARPLKAGGGNLPLVGEAVPVPAGQVGVYVSEAMVDLHGARPGTGLPAFTSAFRPLALAEHAQTATFLVAFSSHPKFRQATLPPLYASTMQGPQQRGVIHGIASAMPKFLHDTH